MDFHLKQWRNQQYESEQQQHPAAKIPKLLLDHHHQIKPESSPVSSALPLFAPDQPNKITTTTTTTTTTTHLSVPFPDQSTTPLVSSSRHPRMGSFFSIAQWQELELQALIFRYMLAGAAVPSELLQPIKKSFSLLHSPPPYFLHHHPLQPYTTHPCHPSALFQTGYWGRGSMDPEPGRCRRTDGKKWRCSRDVVVGQKYCERHMHRGRNRSRKHVETPTSAAAAAAAAMAAGGGGGGGGTLISSSAAAPIGVSALGNAASGGGTHFAPSGQSSSIDLLHRNRSSSDVGKCEGNKDLFEPHDEATGDAKSGGHILRHFFDDWPRSLQESDNLGANASSMNSSTSLSISMPGNLTSDVSLKLSTGDGDGDGDGDGPAQQDGHVGRDNHPQLGWAAAWGSSPMVSMGGPLAEALRSSNSNSSPTSVLHQLPRGSASETCIVGS